MLVVIGGFHEFILGNTYTFVVFSLKAPQVPQPTPPGLPNILAEEEAIHEVAQGLSITTIDVKIFGTQICHSAPLSNNPTPDLTPGYPSWQPEQCMRAMVVQL
jgi:hypothetical protein